MKSVVLEKPDAPVPSVSLIVVFKRFPSEYVQKLLESTVEISLKYEVILVAEQTVPEDVKELLFSLINNKPNLTCLRLLILPDNKKCPVTYGKNVGAVTAKGSILFFADDDALVLDDIAPLVKRLQNSECHGIQPLILKLANRDLIDSAGDFIRNNMGIYGPYVKGAGDNVNKLSKDLHLEEVPSLRGAFMLVKKDAFLAIGGMDESLIFNFEDVDLGWRMVCAGYTLLIDPTVKELHKGSLTTEQPNKVNERVYRLGLVNSFIINLKIVKPHVYPLVTAKFEQKLLFYEFSRIKNRQATAMMLFLNVLHMNRSFIERALHSNVDRRILAKFQFKGRKKLQEMAKGKRFIVKP